MYGERRLSLSLSPSPTTNPKKPLSQTAFIHTPSSPNNSVLYPGRRGRKKMKISPQREEKEFMRSSQGGEGGSPRSESGILFVLIAFNVREFCVMYFSNYRAPSSLLRKPREEKGTFHRKHRGLKTPMFWGCCSCQNKSFFSKICNSFQV